MLFVPPSIPYMVPEADAQDADTTPLTITTFEVYPECPPGCPSDYVRFDVTGTAAPGSTIFTFYMFPDVVGGGDGPLSFGKAVDANGYFDESRDMDGIPITMFNFHGITEHTLAICTTTDTGAADANCVYLNFTWPPPDTTPPVITLICCAMSGDTSENITRQATNSTGYNVTFTVLGTDDVLMANGNTSELIPYDCYLAGGSIQAYGYLFPVGVTTVTCSADDEAGNVGTGTFTVTVLAPADTTPPVLTLDFGACWNDCALFPVWSDATSNVLVGATNSTGSNVNWTVFIHDDEDGLGAFNAQTSYQSQFNSNFMWNSPATCSPVGNSLFPIGITTVTCTATDSAGNTGTKTFTVTVLAPADTTPPVVAVFLTNISNSTSNPAGKTIPFTVLASDNVGVASGPTCSPAGGSTFPIGSTTVTCIATDAAGNVGTESFTITITLEGAADTTPLIIAVPPNFTAQATNSTGQSLHPAGYRILIDKPLYSGINAALVAEWSWHSLYFLPEDVNGNSIQSFGVLDSYGCTNDYSTSGNLYEFATTLLPIGSHTMTCTATHDDGRMGTGTFTVTVILEGAEEEIVIPSWIKNNAGWWANGQIDDRAFVSGLQWLISNGIMNIPPTEQGAGSDDVIPGWIKNNAGWWADNLIDDRNFVTGLQWLITNGIMIIG